MTWQNFESHLPLRSFERKYERFKRRWHGWQKKKRDLQRSVPKYTHNQPISNISSHRSRTMKVRIFCLTGAAIVLRPEASTSFHGFLSEQNVDYCTRHEIMKPPWDSMLTWKSTDFSTRFWWGCAENFFVVPQKPPFQEEWFTPKMIIESGYPKANQANSPATSEFFCHNRPPNWKYYLFRELPAPKLVMRLERRALSTFGRSSSRISCFSKPKRCPGSKHLRRDMKPSIVEAKHILPGATARPSTTVSIMALPFGCLVRKVKHCLHASPSFLFVCFGNISLLILHHTSMFSFRMSRDQGPSHSGLGCFVYCNRPPQSWGVHLTHRTA